VNKVASRTILGIDYGSSRIGLALWKGGWPAARPLPDLARSGNRGLRGILELIQAEQVNLVIVGLPLGEQGGETSVSGEARRFRERLKKRTLVEVQFQDEYGSSIEAREILERTRSGASEHSVAAAIILESFLRSN
jgi:putative Holliday junction resolvase